MKNTTAFMTIIIAILIAGCNNHGTAPIDNPPSAPSGLYSISGDGEVTLYWALNPEPDLKEFALYTSDEEFGVYSLVGITAETYYTFYFLNGVTQYMAVAAIDFAGNESDLSYETIWDTPRPEGYDLTVHALFYDSLNTNSERCAVDFSDYDNYMVQSLDNLSNDIYIDNFEGVLFLNAFDIDTDIALFGPTNKLSDVDYVFSETTEWAKEGYIQLFEDYSYIIWTYDNHFVTIRIEEVYNDRVVFDWAYQTEAGNPQLKISAGEKFKQEKERKLMIHLPKIKK